MFLRSAKNAGFDVPAENIGRAVAFVERCFDEEQGVFLYNPSYKTAISQAMAGAGIVALAHGGKHDTQMAQRSGDCLLTRDFKKYNAENSLKDQLGNVIAITTGYFIVAKQCTNWADAIGRSFFHLLLRLCWPISNLMVRGR